MSARNPARGPGSNQHRDKAPLPPRDPSGWDSLGGGTQGLADPAASLTDTGPVRFEDRIEGASYVEADLRNADWVSNPSLHRVDMAMANAEHARINGTLTHCSFRGAHLKGADLGGIHIGGDFARAELDGARIHATDSCDFTDASMRGVDAMRTSFHNGRFAGASFVGANLTLCQFQGADLSEAVGLEYANVRGCFYDEHTRFPKGYDPEANGWQRSSMDAATYRALARVRADAASGKLGAPDAYAVN